MRNFLSSPAGVIRTNLMACVAALWSATAWATPAAQIWIPANGSAFSGSTLLGTASGTLSETAIGTFAIPSGNGFLDFASTEADLAKAAGLGSRDGGRGLSALDFGFLLAANGTASVVEHGVAVQSTGAYSTSTRFRVGVESASIVFRVDGSIVRTSALALTYPLFAEAVMIEEGATIYDAQIDGATLEAVEWSNAIRVNSRPGQLSRNALDAAGNAGASSTRAIDAGGGYVGFRPSLVSDGVTVGLSNGDSDQTGSDVDFGIRFSGGVVEVLEGGTSKGTFGSHLSTDAFRVTAATGVVTYSKNGSVFYTSLASPTLPLLVDSSVVDSAAGLRDVVLSGDLIAVGVAPPVFSVATGHFASSQTVVVTESTPGSTIYFTTNGVEPTTSDTLVPSGDSVAISSFTILKARAFASGLSDSSSTSATYSFGSITSETATWTNAVAVDTTAGQVLKNSASPAFDAGAVSTRAFASMTGYVEFQPWSDSVGVVSGLSHLDNDQGTADVDFGVRLNPAGSVEVSEGGTIRGAFGGYASTDVFRVSVSEGVVSYSKNGTTFYTSLIAPTAALLVDTSISDEDTGVTNAAISGNLLNSRTATPGATPGPGGYAPPLSVSLTADAGATIRYTTDGVTAPSSGSTLYSTPLAIGVNTTVKARAFKTGYLDSAVLTNAYELITPTPVITPTSGLFVTSVSVSISAAGGAAVYYTTNGDEPTTGSTPYSGAFVISLTSTVKAKAFVSGWTGSTPSSAAYTIQVATPVLSVGSGKWITQQDITARTTTPGATVRYTTDGTTPTTGSMAVGGGGVITISRSMMLKAKAFLTGAVASSAAVGRYAVSGDLQATYYSMVSLKADKTVWVWGGNGYGQLGRGNTTSPQTTPIQVPGLTGVEAIAAGAYHVVALKTDGTLVAWGYNNAGQIGIGTQVDQHSPVAVPGLTNVKAIAAGHSFSMALLANGEVWAWGDNSSGQLADGTSTMRKSPIKTNYATSPAVAQIACGPSSSFVRYSTGTVKGAGANGNGQLGVNTMTSTYTAPVSVLLPASVTEIFAGRLDGAFAAVTQGGTRQLFAWGLNNQGQLGLSSTTSVIRTPTLHSVGSSQVGAGYAHMLAGGHGVGLTAAGSGWVGELGTGANPAGVLIRPAPVAGAPLSLKVTAGAQFSAALGVNGSVWSWGSGGNAATGHGSTATVFVPKQIVSFSLVSNSPALADTDGDGLADGIELDMGTDPENPDTNGDGIDDGAALLLGETMTSLDPDSDGLTTSQEVLLGTNPFAADSDGDATNDGLDLYPFDPTRSTDGPPNPADTTPPVITLQRPVAAIPIP